VKSKMKMRLGASLLAVGLLAIVQEARAAITIDFSNLDNSALTFSNGAFNFTSNTTDQFSITNVVGGVGDSVGLEGYVTPGGPFTIGTITVNPFFQMAPVTGTGTLHITDASSLDLTGNVQWLNVTTFGTGGLLDLTGTVNLTNITYSGTNSDLTALANAGSASDVISFQFNPAETLTQLQAIGMPGLSTSYSGSITSSPPGVPEPASATLIGAALGAMLLRRRRA
jgi:hypothetical protein